MYIYTKEKVAKKPSFLPMFRENVHEKLHTGSHGRPVFYLFSFFTHFLQFLFHPNFLFSLFSTLPVRGLAKAQVSTSVLVIYFF